MTGSSALVVLLGATLLLTGCGEPEGGGASGGAHLEPARLTAATLGDQVVLPTGDYLRMPRYADADSTLGRQLTTQCRGCHTFEAGGGTLLGPNLHGFFGRRVGSVERYDYSPALQAADFIWTPDALDAWLAQPAAFLPGNRMAFAGLSDAEDRDAVIAELLRATSGEPGHPGG